jgi:hypothetical protein
MHTDDLPDAGRRRLLAGGAGVAGLGLLGAAPVLAADRVDHWEAETDVLVVGTGAAAAAAAIAETGASSAKDMGKVMAVLKSRHGAAPDMALPSPIVRAQLAG